MSTYIGSVRLQPGDYKASLENVSDEKLPQIWQGKQVYVVNEYNYSNCYVLCEVHEQTVKDTVTESDMENYSVFLLEGKELYKERRLYVASNLVPGRSFESVDHVDKILEGMCFMEQLLSSGDGMVGYGSDKESAT